MSNRTLVNELDKLVEDSNIYNKGQTKTQKELNEENEVLRNCIESEFEDVTVEGTEITIDDAANYYAKIVLNGNTEQASYDGKSLIDYSALTRYNRDLSGAPSVGSPLRYYNNSKAIQFDVPVTALRGKNIYISFDFQNTNYRRFALDANKNYIETFANGGLIKDSYSYIAVIINSNIDIPISTDIKFMTEQGPTATDYEPYVGGQPSPSPDYPQPIHVVSGNNTINIGSTDYPINLGSLELCKIGDYQDYLYKENGNWYKKPNILKTNFSAKTRISSIQKKTNDQAFNFVFFDYCDLNYNNLSAICTHYPSKQSFVSKSIFNNYQTDTYIVHPFDDIFTSEMTWKEAQAKFHEVYDDKLIFYTKLEQDPIQITDSTLISQLDAIYEHLQLVKGTNNITVTAEDLAPYIELTYKRSNAIKFQKEIDELKAMVLDNS